MAHEPHIPYTLHNYTTMDLHTTFSIGMILISIICILFDTLLLLVVYKNRKDPTLPNSYITIMAVSGMCSKLAILIQYFTFLLLNQHNYDSYRRIFGKEVTMLGTASYLSPLFLCILMTINRLYVVFNPLKMWVFSNKRIFIYHFFLMLLILISVLIPYFSNCSINFYAPDNTFKSACSPNNHKITIIQNKFAVYIPFISMLINILIIYHLRLVRTGTYNKIFKSSSMTMTISNEMSKSKRKQEVIMMRQTIATTVYLTLYEVGRIISQQFTIESQNVQSSIYFIRLMSVTFLNFFVYYIETHSTRHLIHQYFRPTQNNRATSRSVIF